MKRYYSNTAKDNSEFYVGSAIYHTDTTVGNLTLSQLKYMMTDEGRLSQRKDGYFAHEYMLKDHLGNTRVLFGDYNGNDSIESSEVLQQAHYYPFGMAFTGVDLDVDTNKFLYNGKELQTDGGLGWYDYGARMYDPALGRWHVVDPMSEKYLSLSPYNYVANNPILLIDPEGDTINISDAFQNNEQAMKSYNEWASSKAGKRFFRDYGVGGKYENVSVNFDLDTEDDGSSGGTLMFAVNINTGEESQLVPKRSIDAMKERGYNVSNFKSQLGSNEYLKAKISIPGNITDPFVIKQGSTIVHETQHVRLMYKDILTAGYMFYSGSDQHYFMKQKGSRWYNERLEYWKEKKPHYPDDKIDRIINNFEYGWP